MANGNGKNGKSTGTGTSELPGPVKTNTPHWMSAVGLLLMILGYGYQKTAESNPDVVAPYAGLADWGAIAGAMITLGGVGLGIGKDKHAQAVVQSKESKIAEIASAPPVDSNGNASAWLTASTAMHQAAMERNMPLMNALANALTTHGGDGKLPTLLQPGHPDAVPEKGAA